MPSCVKSFIEAIALILRGYKVINYRFHHSKIEIHTVIKEENSRVQPMFYTFIYDSYLTSIIRKQGNIRITNKSVRPTMTCGSDEGIINGELKNIYVYT